MKVARICTVHIGQLDEWVNAWRTLIVSLRREFGFEVHGSWVDGPGGQEDASPLAGWAAWANSDHRLHHASTFAG